MVRLRELARPWLEKVVLGGFEKVYWCNYELELHIANLKVPFEMRSDSIATPRLSLLTKKETAPFSKSTKNPMLSPSSR